MSSYDEQEYNNEHVAKQGSALPPRLRLQLPDYWECFEEKDPASLEHEKNKDAIPMVYYFYNRCTGEISWTPPPDSPAALLHVFLKRGRINTMCDCEPEQQQQQ